MNATNEQPRPVEPPIVPVDAELAPGYRVVAHLNRGRRLDVYDAWSIERDSRCVLKTLRPDRADDRRAVAALTQEGRLLRQFTHPHLVRAYEVVRTTDGSRPVIVLETLGGETLSHLLDRFEEDGTELDPVEVAILGSQLASVLAYLHRHDWLHLDLKPSNIIVVGGSARLIDLSIARRPGRARRGTGTIEYLSPEQARGGRLTTAADVWGLGAVLYAVLTGDPPYAGIDEPSAPSTSSSTDASTWDAAAYPQLTHDPPPIASRRRVPVPLGTVVDGCLRREPEARLSVADAAATLRAWLAADEARRGR